MSNSAQSDASKTSDASDSSATAASAPSVSVPDRVPSSADSAPRPADTGITAPAAPDPAARRAARFTRSSSTLGAVGMIVQIYAFLQLLLAISALASLAGLDPAASVQVIGGWRIGLRAAWFVLALVFAANTALYLVSGFIGHRAGADTSKARPFMVLNWIAVVVTLCGLLAARQTSAGWEAWFSLFIALAFAAYGTTVVRNSRLIG
ncbi:hypothetical protein [Bifidobacterium leontopitheci]|nr:hypothetical protein [Bifidobacterium leontopitheci]